MSTLAGVYGFRTPLPKSESMSLYIHKKIRPAETGFLRFASLISSISGHYTH